MGLREVVQAAAATAVKAVGNIAVLSVYESFVSATYDTSTGVDTVAYSSTHDVLVIFSDFRIEQIDGQNVKAEDKIALIPQGLIPGVEPRENDRVVHGYPASAVAWKVQKVNVDPAGALDQLHVRKT